jgi:hypothetical protein
MDPNQWHTTVIEWSPNLVVFKLDGVEVGRSTTRIPNTPMHWVLQTETKLGGTRPANSVAGNVQIDWVSSWTYVDPKAPVAAPVSEVALTTPAADAAVSGTVPLASAAKSPKGITSVKWYVDGVEVGYSTDGTTWKDDWNSAKVANGRHKVFTKARTGSGTWITSPATWITVTN